MPTQNGYINSIEKKITKTGKDYFSLGIDGTKYNCFKDNMDLRVGDAVQFNFTEKNGYRNLTDWEIVNIKEEMVGAQVKQAVTSAPKLPSVQERVDSTYKTWDQKESEKRDADMLRQKLIVKQSSLSSAVNFCKGKDVTDKDIITLADTFNKWVWENLEKSEKGN